MPDEITHKTLVYADVDDDIVMDALDEVIDNPEVVYTIDMGPGHNGIVMMSWELFQNHQALKERQGPDANG